MRLLTTAGNLMESSSKRWIWQVWWITCVRVKVNTTAISCLSLDWKENIFVAHSMFIAVFLLGKSLRYRDVVWRPRITSVTSGGKPKLLRLTMRGMKCWFILLDGMGDTTSGSRWIPPDYSLSTEDQGRHVETGGGAVHLVTGDLHASLSTNRHNPDFCMF